MRLPQASAHDAKLAPGSERLMVGAVLFHRLSTHLRRTGDVLRRLRGFLRFVDMHLALAYLVLKRSQEPSTTISSDHGATALAAELLPTIVHRWSYRSGGLRGRLRQLYALGSGPPKGDRTISAVYRLPSLVYSETA